MYNLQDLYDMEPAKVVEIAGSMGMKNASEDNLQESIYHILDNQAIDTAKAEVSKGAERGRGDKKDRKPRQKRNAKNEKKDENLSVNSTENTESEAIESSEDNQQSAPKRRGRQTKPEKGLKNSGAGKDDKNQIVQPGLPLDIPEDSISGKANN